MGNAITWRPTDGRRFTFVHTLLDLVPVARRGELLRHALHHLVEPGGRLLVSHYQAPGSGDAAAVTHLRRLGHRPAGASGPDPAASTAWIDAR